MMDEMMSELEVSPMTLLVDAILELVPDAEFNLEDEDIIWLDDRPQPTQDEIISKISELTIQKKISSQKEAFNNAIQNYLDDKAKEYRYDSIMSARSYTGYTNPFQEEAIKLAVWASECWVYAGTVENDIKLGKREMPTIQELLVELPTYIH